MEITDPRWLNAMQAISESVQIVSSKAYVRIMSGGDSDQYQPIIWIWRGVTIGTKQIRL
ncbi:DUF3164 family protein [Avibacterium paragallinarum]|uniref:DUF3164 family protein n=1 Tax=Avibacterium paragallinarum TaxID=728 RepID=UPI0035ABB2E0